MYINIGICSKIFIFFFLSFLNCFDNLLYECVFGIISVIYSKFGFFFYGFKFKDRYFDIFRIERFCGISEVVF